MLIQSILHTKVTNTQKKNSKKINTLTITLNLSHCVPHLIQNEAVLIFYVFHRRILQTGT